MADETETTDTAQPVVDTPPEPSWAHVPDAPPAVIEATRGGACKTCKNKLAVYEGTNPLKVGTGFCEVCGTRQVLKG